MTPENEALNELSDFYGELNASYLADFTAAPTPEAKARVTRALHDAHLARLRALENAFAATGDDLSAAVAALKEARESLHEARRKAEAFETVIKEIGAAADTALAIVKTAASIV